MEQKHWTAKFNDRQYESARLHHRGAFVHPLVRFVATLLLNGIGLRAKIGMVGV
jgi:hypothetical protein